MDDSNPCRFVTDDELRLEAKFLLAKLRPDLRKLRVDPEPDIDEAVMLLRRVYDLGRSRGAFETSEGVRC